MSYVRSGAAVALAICTTSCANYDPYDRYGWGWEWSRERTQIVPPMTPDRRISEQDCRNAIAFDGGNLHCS